MKAALLEDNLINTSQKPQVWSYTNLKLRLKGQNKRYEISLWRQPPAEDSLKKWKEEYLVTTAQILSKFDDYSMGRKHIFMKNLI